MPQPFVSRAVVDAVRGLPHFPQLEVLDLSCGEGEILSQLHRLGCRCRGSHFRDDDYIVHTMAPGMEHIPIDGGVDLLGPLPYSDQSFDVIILAEVLEHLEMHRPVMEEVARILRPQGHLIVTSPNVYRIHSRWRYFWTGTHKLIRRPVGWDLSPDQNYAYHIHPIDLPVLHTLMHQQGLSLRQASFTRFKWRYAFWLFLYPLIYASIRWACWARDKEPESYRTGQADLARWLAHPAVLASEQLLLIAQATPSGGRKSRRPSHFAVTSPLRTDGTLPPNGSH